MIPGFLSKRSIPGSQCFGKVSSLPEQWHQSLSVLERNVSHTANMVKIWARISKIPSVYKSFWFSFILYFYKLKEICNFCEYRKQSWTLILEWTFQYLRLAGLSEVWVLPHGWWIWNLASTLMLDLSLAVSTWVVKLKFGFFHTNGESMVQLFFFSNDGGYKFGSFHTNKLKVLMH